MKPAPFDYFAPTTIDEALEHLDRGAGDATILAGGQTLLPLLALRMSTPGIIVDINRKFGLSAEQVERLAPDRQLVVFKAITAGGTMLVGRIVTRELVMSLLRMVGVRLSAQQAAKYVPIAGQGLAAVLTYGALRYVCEQHIKQCMAICEQLRLPAPTVVTP